MSLLALTVTDMAVALFQPPRDTYKIVGATAWRCIAWLPYCHLAHLTAHRGCVYYSYRVPKRKQVSRQLYPRCYYHSSHQTFVLYAAFQVAIVPCRSDRAAVYLLGLLDLSACTQGSYSCTAVFPTHPGIHA